MNELVKFTRDSLYQRIKASFIDPDYILLPADQDKYDELLRIWSLRFKNKYTRSQIIDIIMRPDETGKRISHATAYRKYLFSMQIFGEIDVVNIAAERNFLKESFEEQYQNAKKAGDFKSAISALKELKTLTNFVEDVNKVDPKKLEASVYKLVLPRGATKLINAMFESGVVDFNSLGAEDVEFKDVSEEDEAEEITGDDE